MQTHRLVEIPVAVRIRARPDKHLHPWQAAVRRGSKIRVICAVEILGFGTNKIIAKAAAPKIVLLEITPGFCKTVLVHDVVVPVGPEENVGNRAGTIICAAWSIDRRIVRKIEYTIR